jgi:hypothetical protein
MIQVRLLTEEQKEILLNKEYNYGLLFNPIQDFNYNWIISDDEVTHCVYIEYQWIKDLPLIDWEPPIEEEI